VHRPQRGADFSVALGVLRSFSVLDAFLSSVGKRLATGEPGRRYANRIRSGAIDPARNAPLAWAGRVEQNSIAWFRRTEYRARPTGRGERP